MEFINNVFIDTSIFSHSKFLFNEGKLRRFEKAAKEKEIQIFTTSVTNREIEKNIKEEFEKGLGAFIKFKKAGRILRNINSEDIHRIFNSEFGVKEEKKIIKEFHNFLRRNNIVEIEINDVPADKVFEKYFESSPPFGEKKKKAEFPDAFVLIALEDWCKKNDQKMLIISEDKDMKNYCEDNPNLISLSSIDEFLDLLTRKNQSQHDLIIKMVENYLSQIKEMSLEKFESLDFWLEDKEGEIKEIKVKEIILGEPYLIEISNKKAILSFNGDFFFSAKILIHELFEGSEFEDFEDDDQEEIWQTYHKSFDDKITTQVELEVSYDNGNTNQLTLHNVTINGDGEIGLFVD